MGALPLALPRRSAADRRDSRLRWCRRARRDARLLGEWRSLRVRVAAARTAGRQRRLRPRGGVGARPHRGEPRAGRHLLAAVDARPRLDVGLAPGPLARARANARRRDALHAARRRTLGGRGALERRGRPADATRRRRASGRAPPRVRRRRLVGRHRRHVLDPRARRSRPSRRSSPRGRPTTQSSRPGSARPRTSTSRRPRRTATPQ